ncbi:hypothetical protein [Flavobacterium sp.]|uniref:hypothetical protein n=1 Tax=Flavobacterium sp. TaxID=239 RepID=UPI002620E368|nr:hypothetical protein [Flavobacterium sp.]
MWLASCSGKNYYYGLISCLFVLIGCQNEKHQTTYGKIRVTDTSHFEVAKTSPLFTIQESVDNDFRDFGNILILKKINPNCIQIKNVSNDGYTGQSITFTIDSTLTIVTANYSHWTDAQDGSKESFTVDQLTAKLSKNPFKEGIEKLEGEFEVKATTTRYPSEFYKFPFQYRNDFFGRFQS